MAEKIYWLDFDIGEKFMTGVFEKIGVPTDEAKICANVLITADKKGFDSHGLARMKTIYYDRIKEGVQLPKTKFEIIKEGPTTLLINGNHGMGHVISKKSMDLIIEKAKKNGMGMAAVTNSTHYGIAGYWVEMATRAGMIGITGTNARPSVSPTFGVENMLGTNPLTLGTPTDEPFPFILDCATSIIQRGKVEVYDRIKKPLPKGVIVNEKGESETNATKVLKDLSTGKAALLPLGGLGEDLGGYKGYGFSTFVEILSAALQNGPYLKMLSGLKDGKKTHPFLGHFFIAINVESFIKLDLFKKTAGNILRDLRNSKKAPGEKRIYTAGEKEYYTYLERKDKGVPLGEANVKEILEMRNETGVNFKFDFE